MTTLESFPVPHLTTAHNGPLLPIEEVILSQVQQIETWFRMQWQKTPAPITSSVDLRHAGFKLAPVDTNLFPAGFNNLNPDFMPLCVQAIQSVMTDYLPGCKRVLIIPESHTRNLNYLQSLYTLQDIVTKAGFDVRIGSLDESLTEASHVETARGDQLVLEPVIRDKNIIRLKDFEPCVLLLNNDLSSGMPKIIENVEQRIRPTEKLGWASRLKSRHFKFYDDVAHEFSSLVGIEPWLINPYFETVHGIDFMAQDGLDLIADKIDMLLAKITHKYEEYGVDNKPFVVVKADNGTYGMSVLMVQSADEIRQLNRKKRTKMSSAKGSQKVERVIIQEGVYTLETMPNGDVAEPVIYMLGSYVVGGFYRVHKDRGVTENLNAPGMHFEPIAFEDACNLPCQHLGLTETPNRFYVYGVVARLAALAAAREIDAIER